MSFAYRNGVLCVEEVPLDSIAQRFGTPCYVYSRAAIESAYGEFARAVSGRDALICYSVKANSNLSILRLLASLGAGLLWDREGSAAAFATSAGVAAMALAMLCLLEDNR